MRTSLTILAALIVVVAGVAGHLILKPMALDALRDAAAAMTPDQSTRSHRPAAPLPPSPPAFDDLDYRVATFGDEADFAALERIDLLQALASAKQAQREVEACNVQLDLRSLRTLQARHEREAEAERQEIFDEAMREAREAVRESHVVFRTNGRAFVSIGVGDDAI